MLIGNLHGTHQTRFTPLASSLDIIPALLSPFVYILLRNSIFAETPGTKNIICVVLVPRDGDLSLTSVKFHYVEM